MPPPVSPSVHSSSDGSATVLPERGEGASHGNAKGKTSTPLAFRLGRMATLFGLRSLLRRDKPGTCTHISTHFSINTFTAAVHDTFDYEQKYAADKEYEEMSPTARIWKIYLDECAKFDLEMVEIWRDNLDMLLVFVCPITPSGSRTL